MPKLVMLPKEIKEYSDMNLILSSNLYSELAKFKADRSLSGDELLEQFDLTAKELKLIKTDAASFPLEKLLKICFQLQCKMTVRVIKKRISYALDKKYYGRTKHEK
jgi:DNA-binding Xre family transcriptional regulator